MRCIIGSDVGRAIIVLTDPGNQAGRGSAMAAAIQWIRVRHRYAGRAVRVLGVTHKISSPRNLRGRKVSARYHSCVAGAAIGRRRPGSAKVPVNVIEAAIDVGDLNGFAMKAGAPWPNRCSPRSQKVDILKSCAQILWVQKVHTFDPRKL